MAQTSTAEQTEEWRSIALRPIRPEAPAGDSARYDGAYERLQSEISKMENLSGTAIQWNEVIRLAKEILGEKSKDLLVASYLCRALFEEQGYLGLLSGLSCLEAMAEPFWEVLYPESKRMRARTNAIVWLSEKVGVAVTRKAPRPAEEPLVRGCSEKIGTLERFFDEKLGGDSPGLGDLRRALEQRLRETQAPQNNSRSETPLQETPVDAAAGASLFRKIDSAEEAERVLDEATDPLRKAAALVRGADPSNPWPYRLVRSLTWMKIDELPGNRGEETRVPSPSPQAAERYPLLVRQGSWRELIEEAESQVSEAPFWLDLHRFSALALARLGPSFSKAREALVGELLLFVRRLPGLPELKFADGTPFADGETRSWLERERGVDTGRAPGPSQSEGASEEIGERISQLRGKAGPLLEEGRIKEALALYQSGMETVGSKRDRFLWRLELARVCLEAGQERIALSQLEGMDREMTRLSLEEWEPALSLEVLKALWGALDRLLRAGGEPAVSGSGRMEAVYARMCRLDPVSALDLEQRRTSER